MAHNFRTGADFYVSKAGSDTTGNGSADNPYNSLIPQAFNSATACLGTGSYKWPILYRRGGAGNDEFTSARAIADGLVKIIGDGGTTFTRMSAGGGVYQDIYFDKFGGFSFRYAGAPRNAQALQRCVFKVVSENAGIANSACTGDSYYNCIFINLNGNLGASTFFNCLFFNCTLKVLALNKCYLDPTTAIECQASGGDGQYYAADACVTSSNNVDPRTDTTLNRGLNIAGAGWGKTSPSGVSLLPQFNSLAKEDWSLQKSSPHIGLGIGPVHLRYANTLFLENLGIPGDLCTTNNTQLRFSASQAVVRLLSISGSPDALVFNNQGGLVRKPDSNGNGYSVFVTNRIPYSDIPQEVTAIRLFAGLNFDTDYPALESQISLASPNVYNNNVPDYSNGSSGSAGRNPNRLSFRMRWSTNVDPDPANPDHWVSGANWIEMEWNTKPLWLQSQNLGNGNAAFNPSAVGVTSVVARFLQLEVTIRDNYFSH